MDQRNRHISAFIRMVQHQEGSHEMWSEKKILIIKKNHKKPEIFRLFKKQVGKQLSRTVRVGRAKCQS